MVELEEIGIIQTPYKKDEDVPHQAYKSNKKGKIKIKEEYEEALKDIQGFSHLILLYKFHKPIKKSIKKDKNLFLKTKNQLVNPFLDTKYHGIFSTRSPIRPNPIGLSIVKLLEKKENTLKVKEVDMLDKTPLLDIKPYVPEFDQRKKVKTGWLEKNFKNK
ncbi:MAG: tRNA (Thr-GGU) A37 N-methylase TsaA [Candidatus Methanohalarchaeum thermophilum]|uniref:tRNA (Thr-GGU) A37 N-methylase TsaA n=1 Tax=Methanohalarchaeum thermophilum TaxID=1903181 RepID=A0A1Q6DX60_METT1|nr:MAG: tRNA (Thr-GGU) A37 N-methylase TsaA [Candidatus Methanohalarchaeum thermophilum]